MTRTKVSRILAVLQLSNDEEIRQAITPCDTFAFNYNRPPPHDISEDT
ncbi:hypothetical protein [Brunnivagina elsteri]|nr:hypothetical protein [Calothrix elsteri]